MTSLYKLIGGDGIEYGPMDQSAVRAMYRDGRATKDTLVFVSFRGQWARLADVFDVGKWDSSDEPDHRQTQVVAPANAVTTTPIATPKLSELPAADLLVDKPARSNERACSKCNAMIATSMIYCPFCGAENAIATRAPAKPNNLTTPKTVLPKETFNFLPLSESKASRFWPWLIKWFLIPLSLMAADAAVAVIATSRLNPPLELTTIWILSGIAYSSLGLAWAVYFYKEERVWSKAAIPLGIFLLLRIVVSVAYGGDRATSYVVYSFIEALIFGAALSVSVLMLRLSENHLRFTAMTDEVGAAPTEVISILGDRPGLPKGRREFTAICGKCGQETKTHERRKSFGLLKSMQGEMRERFSCEKCGAFIGGNPIAVVSVGLIEMISAVFLAMFLVSISSKPHPLSFLFVLVSFGDGLRRFFMGLVGLVRSLPHSRSV